MLGTVASAAGAQAAEEAISSGHLLAWLLRCEGECLMLMLCCLQTIHKVDGNRAINPARSGMNKIIASSSGRDVDAIDNSRQSRPTSIERVRLLQPANAAVSR